MNNPAASPHSCEIYLKQKSDIFGFLSLISFSYGKTKTTGSQDKHFELDRRANLVASLTQLAEFKSITRTEIQ